MNTEASGYDPMSVRNSVDDIYSSHEVQEYLRAQRSMRSETSLRRQGRTIRVDTIMNSCISELFGKRSENLDNNAAAQNEITVVDNS